MLSLPETQVDLRRTLGRVNLRSWLPEILCGDNESSQSVNSSAAHDLDLEDQCRDFVDGVLLASPAEVSASAIGVDAEVLIR